MSTSIPPDFLAVNSITYQEFDYEINDTGTGDYTTGALDIGAEPVGSDRRYVIGLFAAIDDNNNQFDSGCKINGTTSTSPPDIISASENSFTTMVFLEVPTGTTCTMTSSFVGTPTIGNQFFGALTVITGANGLEVSDSSADSAASTTLTVSETIGPVEEGGLKVIVGAGRQAGSFTCSNVTERGELINGTKSFVYGWDFDNAYDASVTMGVNPVSSTSVGMSCISIKFVTPG